MAQYDFDLREYWRIIKKRKFIIVFTTIAMGLFSLIFAILGSPTPLYKTSAAVKFEKTGLASGLYLQTVSMSQGDDMQTQLAIIKSYYIIEVVAKKLGMIPDNLVSEEINNQPKYINVINRLKGMIDTEQESQSSIINITATSEDPKFAQRLANTVVSVYKEQRTLELNKRTIDARKFVEEQLKVAREKLKNSEDAVRDFREKYKIISIDAQSGALMGQLSSYRSTYEKATIDYEKIQVVLRELNLAESRPLTSKTSFYLDEASSIYKNLNDRLVQLLMDRDALLITYTDQYPQVVEIRKRIHELVQNMKAQLAAQGKGLRENISLLNKRINETESQIRSLPEKGLELARLERNVKVDTEVYSLLEKSYQESLIKEAEKVEDVQIVRPALEPTSPTNPPKTNATAGVGTILGMILGMVFAFLIETFDTSIGTIEEVENFLGVPVLGVVPQINLKDLKLSLDDKYAGKVDEDTADRASRLISHFIPQSTFAESYRALRTNLNFACREEEVKTIAFTSATPREGKTTSIVNLAITIAQTGQRVLLVEADLRKPVIAHMFGIDQSPGLSDSLLGNFEWGKSVKTIADIMMGKLNIDEVLETPGMDNLHVIPSGTIPPNPAELINSNAMNDFIDWAKSSYDWVLVDAPPVLAATDAALLGSKLDGVVIVYRVGKISRVTLRRAKSQLENVKAKVLGVILNGIKADISADFADYDYKYYHYYGGKEEERTLLGKLQAFPLTAFNWVKNRILRKGSTMPEKVEEPADEAAADEKKEPDLSALRHKMEQRKERQAGSVWKGFVLLVALGALASGIAYQMGYVRPPDPGEIIRMIRSYVPFAEKNPPKTNGVKKSITRNNGSTPVPGPSQDAQPAAPAPAAEPERKAPETPAPGPSGGATSAPSQPAPADQPARQSTRDQAHTSARTSARAPIDKPYSIQVKAVRSSEEAAAVVKSLSARGLEAYSIKVDLNGTGIWHRILIGHFSGKEEARRYLIDQKIESDFPGSLVRRVPAAPAAHKNLARHQEES